MKCGRTIVLTDPVRYLQFSITLFVNLGVVQLADDLDEAFDPETDENVATLLVHNIVPPFLDGRIVFTKQSQPIVPVSFNKQSFHIILMF